MNWSTANPVRGPQIQIRTWLAPRDVCMSHDEFEPAKYALLSACEYFFAREEDGALSTAPTSCWCLRSPVPEHCTGSLAGRATASPSRKAYFQHAQGLLVSP